MISTQAFIFTVMVFCGAAAALLYGVLYILRYISHFNRAVCLIADFTAVVFCAALYYIVLLRVGNGEMRLYTMVGFFVGFCIVFKLIGKLSHFAPPFRSLYVKAKTNVILKKIFK